MDPFLLTFTNPTLERAYDQERDRLGLWSRDKGFFQFFGFLIGCLWYCWIFAGKEELAYTTVWFTAGWVSVASIFSLYRLGEGSKAPHWRTRLAVFLRVYVAVGVATGAIWAGKPVMWKLHEKFFVAAIQILFACYAPQFMMSSLSVRLKFREHIIEQAICTLIITSCEPKLFCTVTAVSPGYQHLQRFGSWIGKIAHRLFTALIGKFDLDPPESNVQCIHVMVFLQIFVSCGLVSYLVWMVEKRSRMMFIESISKTSAWRNEQLPVVTYTTWSIVTHHVVGILLCAAVCWELLIALGGFVPRVGMWA